MGEKHCLTFAISEVVLKVPLHLNQNVKTLKLQTAAVHLFLLPCLFQKGDIRIFSLGKDYLSLWKCLPYFR